MRGESWRLCREKRVSIWDIPPGCPCGLLLWAHGQQLTNHMDCDVFPVCFFMVALGDVTGVGPTVLHLCILDDEDGADLVGGPRQEVSHRLYSLPCLHNGDRRYSLRNQEDVLPLELQRQAHEERRGCGGGPQSGCHRDREHALIRGH